MERISHGRMVVNEWKQAWRQGVAALLAGSLGYSLYPALSSLFVEPLQHQFGWSRGDIAFVHSFGLITAFVAPIIGRLTDHHGVRPILSAGLALTVIGYLLLAMMRGSLGYYYAAYFFFSLVGMATTGITVTRILSGAFERTRGTALAIGRSGLAVVGALMPILLFPVIGRFGTAGGYLLLGGIILFLPLPLITLWLPRIPSATSGLHPGPSSGAEPWRVLLSRPKVRILIAASVFNYVPVVALLSQMKPLAVDKGLDAMTAVGAVSIMGMAAAAGALLSGVLVDRLWAPAVAFFLNLAPAIGCLLLLQQDVPPALFYGAVLMIGLGQGAEIDIVAFMIARYFGLRSYATIYSLSTLGIALGVAVGASLIGRAYDHFGNYDISVMAASACFALAAIFYLAMGRYPQHDLDGV
ncbi:MFS transporter [Sphingobium yanoikuyae]|uniref:MFS transporter n=1 Tax=Sphingobium yanoikuyae TaxID=13690 RepID=A0A291MZY1_SPHYA|nr:MFS transporter [Sphingobium yanoikuyae]ATI80657.1 MFS transporter [Sphingobium yanoikuyae]